jgi:hypothetical protein
MDEDPPRSKNRADTIHRAVYRQVAGHEKYRIRHRQIAVDREIRGAAGEPT